VRRISSAFSFYVGEDFFRNSIRVNGRLEPTGCLGDLGWYCLRFSLWTMNWQLPHTVTGRILSQPTAVSGREPAPTELSGELIFDGGVSAGFYCSFLAPLQQWVSVSGQKGWLRMPDFVHPFDTYEPAFEVNRAEVRVTDAGGGKVPSGADRTAAGHPMAQDTRMFRNFASQVFSGNLNEDWPMWALKTQQVMDACYQSARNGSAGVTL
jgi:predicted dehydrogenase